jgi:hypothetical protein
MLKTLTRVKWSPNTVLVQKSPSKWCARLRFYTSTPIVKESTISRDTSEKIAISNRESAYNTHKSAVCETDFDRIVTQLKQSKV